MTMTKIKLSMNSQPVQKPQNQSETDSLKQVFEDHPLAGFQGFQKSESRNHQSIPLVLKMSRENSVVNKKEARKSSRKEESTANPSLSHFSNKAVKNMMRAEAQAKRSDRVWRREAPLLSRSESLSRKTHLPDFVTTLLKTPMET